jgi:hypothetical protein
VACRALVQWWFAQRRRRVRACAVCTQQGLVRFLLLVKILTQPYLYSSTRHENVFGWIDDDETSRRSPRGEGALGGIGKLFGW